MKYLILISLLISPVTFAVCVIESNKIELVVEEQMKGPPIKSTKIWGLNAFNADEIVSIIYSDEQEHITVEFKNKSTQTLSYDLERYQKLIKDWRNCK